MTDKMNRKRKQEYHESKPLSSTWSDYVYSTPNSPSQDIHTMDTLLQNTLSNNPTAEYEHTRRHSVAVGDLHTYHDQIKKEVDVSQWNNVTENVLNASLPSSWSSSSSNGSALDQQYPILHRRAMSLRLDTQSHSDNHSPTFFSPTFLDALKTEDHSDLNEMAYHLSDNIIHDFMLQNTHHHTNSNTISSTPQSLTTNITTITPSVISGGDINEYWLLNQPNLMDELSLDKHKHPSSPSNTSSLSTPSPPITPLQSSHINYDNPLFYHPSIPEEEEDNELRKDSKTNNKHFTLTTRIRLSELNASVMKPMIQHYLMTAEGERKITILTSRVAQKSYGTEKRFLCPPPSTILSGASWWTQPPTNSIFQTMPTPPAINVHILGEKTTQKGAIEWYTSSGTIIDNTSVIAHSHSDTNMSGHCVSKQLHINDADEKRKRVEVLINIKLGNDLTLGTFPSKGIKVISKPSKKRQSVKNMELCIHHGTTVSLFNRIRSQTVSTKYLGVFTNSTSANGTCFVARTGSWDPFVIWIVDTTNSDIDTTYKHHPDNPYYPAPPAIALKTTRTPVALHYNQPIVLQCVNTGLVSPIMVIRKVDKGSMILGGNRLDDLSGLTGGECGDEALGDPVSQLHKVAFQIVHDPAIARNNKENCRSYSGYPNNEWTLPEQSTNSLSYLACLNDVVGMHKTTNPRTVILSKPIPPSEDNTAWSDLLQSDRNDLFLSSVVSQQVEGKITRKRRVSCDVVKPLSSPAKFQPSISTKNNRRRVNSLNDTNRSIKSDGPGRRYSTSTFSEGRGGMTSDTSIYHANGACWTEDVSDAAVWTIVGTDSISYKFWTPSSKNRIDLNSPFAGSGNSGAVTPFPILSSSTNYMGNDNNILNIIGENLTRDISVWFGDVKSKQTEYKSKESISCVIPELTELMESPISTVDKDTPSKRRIPILLVRGDGVVYNPDLYYIF